MWHKRLIELVKSNFSFENLSDIPNEIKNTFDGMPFLIHDSVIENNGRIIVFSTDSNLIHLSNSDVWLIDGTFKVVPNGFEQLVTMQARIRNIYVCLVYALLPKKNNETYNEFFRLIWQKFSVNRLKI